MPSIVQYKGLQDSYYKRKKAQFNYTMAIRAHMYEYTDTDASQQVMTFIEDLVDQQIGDAAMRTREEMQHARVL